MMLLYVLQVLLEAYAMTLFYNQGKARLKFAGDLFNVEPIVVSQ